MSSILNSLNAYNLLIFQPILMILVSKFMVYRALSDKNTIIVRVAVPFKIEIQKKSFYQFYFFLRLYDV